MKNKTLLRPIPDFPGYYINDLGEVWSTKQHKKKKLKPNIGDTNYHVVRLRKNNKTYSLRVSRLVLNAPKNKYVDHIDGDLSNNKKDNLRLCSLSQNQWNRKIQSNGTSKYKGVCLRLNKKSKKWRAEICKNRKIYRIGLFDNEVEAAVAYNEKAKELFGEFAKLNIV